MLFVLYKYLSSELFQNFHYSCYTGSMEILTTNPFQKMLCDEKGGGGGGQAKMSQNIVGVPPMPMLSASLA